MNNGNIMRIEHHLVKFRRFENTITKLDYREDYETMIEDFMLAASHLINASMRKLGNLKIDKDIISLFIQPTNKFVGLSTM